MLFNVEQDLGHSIAGYVVLDGFEGSARIQARAEGRLVYEGVADRVREALAVAGRHRTGECGFELTETDVPGLSAMEELEIREAGGDALIYRRLLPHHAPKRVLRLESHLLPLWRLDNALNPRFQYFANQIEALGRETTTQMFLQSQVGSIYLSGRLLYRAFQTCLDGHFDIVFSMHHPYEELAERLIVLAQIKSTGSDILGLRENMSLGPTMAFAQSLPLDDERALARALRDMPDSVARVLANPVVRQLTVTFPEEMPTRSALSSALAALSTFKVVGLRRAPKAFVRAVAELAEASATGTLAVDELPGVTAFARMLKRTREIDWLIEQDLALYQHVADAYRSTAQATDSLNHAHDV